MRDPVLPEAIIKAVGTEKYTVDKIGEAIWINRSDKTVPDGVIAVNHLLDIFGTSFFRE